MKVRSRLVRDLSMSSTPAMPLALCSGAWLSTLALFRWACDGKGFAVAVDEVLLELREPGRNPPSL
jgi:hypothetical protein